MPSLAPVDHTFRFFEPEQSHFTLGLPPFMQLNQPGMQIVLSDPSIKADFFRNQNFVTVSGMTGEAMSVT